MVTFKLKGVPPSYNKHFKINYNLREITLTPQVRAFKQHVQTRVPVFTPDPDDFFFIIIRYYHDWYYKNGKYRKLDLQNLDKLLIDAIFKKIGIDDSRLVFFFQMKIQNDKESFTQVEIEHGRCVRELSLQMGKVLASFLHDFGMS